VYIVKGKSTDLHTLGDQHSRHIKRNNHNTFVTKCIARMSELHTYQSTVRLKTIRLDRYTVGYVSVLSQTEPLYLRII